MKKVPVTGENGSGLYILVDDCDFDLVAQHKWNIDTQGYAMTHIHIYGSDFKVRIHRYILNPSSNEQIDHRNRNKLDNTRANLRIASQAQNQHNSRKPNKSGYKGVSLDKRKNPLLNRWCASITINRKKIYIGRYATKEEAALAYNEIAKKYYGEFAYLNIIPDNHLKGEHNV